MKTTLRCVDYTIVFSGVPGSARPFTIRFMDHSVKLVEEIGPFSDPGEALQEFRLFIGHDTQLREVTQGTFTRVLRKVERDRQKLATWNEGIPAARIPDTCPPGGARQGTLYYLIERSNDHV